MSSSDNTRTPAKTNPVVRVLPLLGLPQLDRLFDYYVRDDDSDAAQPGVRVRVRFSGRLVDAIVYERASRSEHAGPLAYIERVISPEPVLTPDIRDLVEHVALRWVGNRSDVLRLALPPRHAGAEKSVPAAEHSASPSCDTDQQPTPQHLPPAWERYPRAYPFAEAVRAGRAVRSAWTLAPGEQWAQRLAEIALLSAHTGKQSLIIVPDQRDLDRVVAATKDICSDYGIGVREVVDLSAGLGPQARYSRWLRALRGHARVIVGTRSAVWTPLRHPGLLAVWDDGDDSFAEPRAPYPHTRDVAALRSQLSGIPLLLASRSRTPEVAILVESGWAPEITASSIRDVVPRIVAVTNADPIQARDVAGGHTRVPTVAISMAKGALDRGQPVLVQTPRRGYIPTLSCQQCRTPARCRRCNGPLSIGATDDSGAGTLTCRWCGVPEVSYTCPNCGSKRLRAGAIGHARTAEELGRMFPGTRVISVTADSPPSDPPSGPMLVVATPGAEPEAAHGYGAALLLDAWALLNRPDLRTTEDTLRRWLAAASLVIPHHDGGEVFCSADAGLPVTQALIRWDPAGFARRELAERRELGFPPAMHMFAIDGDSADVAGVADYVETALTQRHQLTAEILGPVELPANEPIPGGELIEVPERILIRVPAVHVRIVARALRAAIISRASKREGEAVRVRLDPLNIG